MWDNNTTGKVCDIGASADIYKYLDNYSKRREDLFLVLLGEVGTYILVAKGVFKRALKEYSDKINFENEFSDAFGRVVFSGIGARKDFSMKDFGEFIKEMDNIVSSFLKKH